MRTIPVTAMLVLGLLMLAPPVAAHGETVHLEVEARESGCTGARDLCFEVTDGNLDNLAPGADVEVTFQNQGENGHQFWATTKANADPGNQDTSDDTALNGTQDTVGPGSSATVTFTVPEDAQGVYFWCDVGDHEGQGMWILHDIEGAGAADDGDGAGAPGLGVPVVLLVGLLCVYALNRRAR